MGCCSPLMVEWQDSHIDHQLVTQELSHSTTHSCYGEETLEMTQPGTAGQGPELPTRPAPLPLHPTTCTFRHIHAPWSAAHGWRGQGHMPPKHWLRPAPAPPPAPLRASLFSFSFLHSTLFLPNPLMTQRDPDALFCLTGTWEAVQSGNKMFLFQPLLPLYSSLSLVHPGPLATPIPDPAFSSFVQVKSPISGHN